MPRLTTLLALMLGYGAPGGAPRPDRMQRPDATIAYGQDPLQRFDIYFAGAGPRPLVAFVHGGAWQFGDKARRLTDRKAAFCRAEGWHFASINFRMVPEVPVDTMVADLSAAVSAIHARTAELGVDPRRIVLMGHSSGAHLAAMVACNPAAAPLLAGVVANDGASYDARVNSLGGTWLARRLIHPAFPPGDIARLAALSPVVRAAQGGPWPPFLLLHAARRHAQRQAMALEQALHASATPAQRHACAGRTAWGHMMLSRRLGETGFPATEITRRWLRQRFADQAGTAAAPDR